MTFAQRPLDAGGRSVERDREFRCPLCRTRCTGPPIAGSEPGRRDGCPHRPENVPPDGGGATDEAVVDGRPVASPCSETNASDEMGDPAEVFAVLVALEFVIVAAAVFLLVPLESAASLVPLFVLFLLALYAYRS